MKLICKGLAFAAKVASLAMVWAAVMMMLSVLTVLLPITICAAGAAAVYGVGVRLELYGLSELKEGGRHDRC